MANTTHRHPDDVGNDLEAALETVPTLLPEGPASDEEWLIAYQNNLVRDTRIADLWSELRASLLHHHDPTRPAWATLAVGEAAVAAKVRYFETAHEVKSLQRDVDRDAALPEKPLTRKAAEPAGSAHGAPNDRDDDDAQEAPHPFQPTSGVWHVGEAPAPTCERCGKARNAPVHAATRP